MDQESASLSGSLALRGVLSIIFGFATVFWPGVTILTVLYLFSAYVLIDGLVNVVVGVGRLFNGRNAVLSRFFALIFGVLQVGVGVYLLRHPGVSFATFILLIGFTFIFRGVFEIFEGIFEEGASMHRMANIFLGGLSILAGVVMLFQPVASGVAFVWILGFYALISGPLLIAMSMSIKNAKPVKVARAK